MTLAIGLARDGSPNHVRRFNPWQDGKAIATLLDQAFYEELRTSSSGAGEPATSRSSMASALQNMGSIEALALQRAPGFVWEEDGQLVGHASIQRNPTRSDTWVIGNVATRADMRNRGISTALVQAAIAFAAQQFGARNVALQVMDGNTPAHHVYKRCGFETLTSVTRYRNRTSQLSEAGSGKVVARRTRLRDRAHVSACVSATLTEQVRYSESFDDAVYRLDIGWWLWNSLNGNRDQWHRTERGALRTRANFDLAEHHLELFLQPEATIEEAHALVGAGLQRLNDYVSKPVAAMLPREQHVAHAALMDAGFKPTQTFVHMLKRLK